MNKNEIVGNRYSSLENLKKDLEKYYNCKIINIVKSQSESIENIDNMIDYELENSDNVYTLFYLFDNQKNYYITEL